VAVFCRIPGIFGAILESMATRATARIDLRLREDLKDLIEEAAELSAQTVASFVSSTVVERAKAVVESAQRLRLGRTDAEAFLAALDRPVDRHDALARLIRNVEEKARPAARKKR
jgi:uncharacterized protein (DUF1778 family)